MRVGELSIEWHDERVEVRRGDTCVATATWRGGELLARSGALRDDEWRTVSDALRGEEDRIIAEASREAHDARGVDVTQIDWMLSLTPRQRLAALEAHARSIAPWVPDAPPD